MRAFLVACLAIVVIGAGAYYFVNATQKPAGVAYTTDSARIDPKWSWRAECNVRNTWQWIFVDFGSPAGESPLCSASQ
jgi:hypothetical protein